MLLRPSSPAPWSGGPSHPCAKCGTLTPGIAIGELCASCRRIVQQKASRIGRLVAIGTTLPLALYIVWSLPPERTARTVGAAAVLVWYILTSLIARRVALEWLK